ncbi:MAG: hypothetical protein B6229_07020 [Spirochaetaceae bacterium 4572_7]|nr:MAG: hypothetical protein B6229_07020 [Spirochaetaceae bacterium 4572_7]
MKYSIKKELITGVAIPVSSLKSSESCGIGEFLDLKKLGEWCSSVNIDLIQLLPVNDTGFQSSPYSAISAFALHPAYIRISELKEVKFDDSETKKLKRKWEKKESLDFSAVLKDKLAVLYSIYQKNITTIKKSSKIKQWEKNNQWIKNYAIYSFLKNANVNNSWDKWEKYTNPTSEELKKLYTKHRSETLFYSWVQYNLELQLSEVTIYLESLGVNLKGDIPILMDIDSADVWEYRDIFNTNNRAGAPPDMFSESGQNWGFPTYNWDIMKKDDYSWWKARLKQAAKFYHAYRIDHVLGFFRIWTIPETYDSGSMGYYSPNKFIERGDLHNIGFSDERITWLSKAHIPGYELRERLSIESNQAIKSLLTQIGDEDLYLFKDSIHSVSDIRQCEDLSDDAIGTMVNFFQNITFIQIDKNQFAPTWFHYNSRAYNTLSDHEKYLLAELQGWKGEESKHLWREQGLTLLKLMTQSAEMLVCAEDLGTIPDCVPEVLEELGILGLHVTRWSKDYHQYGEPFLKPSAYNYLSVSTPAVHDSSTLRQWITEQRSMREISETLNLNSELGSEPSPENMKKVIGALLKTSSKIAMFQFQDLLSINEELPRKNLESERINVPGTISDKNWSYRMDFTIEKLIRNKSFNNELENLISERG